MERLVLSILVDNTPGVLNRVAGLFSRRSYNIDSLTVGETNNPHISRMTVVSTGDAETLEQIEKQVRKLEDVKEVFKLEDTNSVYRELVLIKVECSHKERVDIVSIVDIYRGKIVDVSPDSMVIEITGTQSKIDGLLAMMTDFNVTEIVRTGIAGIGRGLRDEDKEKIKAR